MVTLRSLYEALKVNNVIGSLADSGVPFEDLSGHELLALRDLALDAGISDIALPADMQAKVLPFRDRSSTDERWCHSGHIRD
jgi:hypothetical protein